MTRKPRRRTVATKRPASKSRSKPASRTARKSKPARADDLDTFIAAAARTLDLPTRKAWLPAIKANLKVTLQLAAVVAAFDLPDDAEPAPVFRA
jgi:hypothetical protein